MSTIKAATQKISRLSRGNSPLDRIESSKEGAGSSRTLNASGINKSKEEQKTDSLLTEEGYARSTGASAPVKTASTSTKDQDTSGIVQRLWQASGAQTLFGQGSSNAAFAGGAFANQAAVAPLAGSLGSGGGGSSGGGASRGGGGGSSAAGTRAAETSTGGSSGGGCGPGGCGGSGGASGGVSGGGSVQGGSGRSNGSSDPTHRWSGANFQNDPLLQAGSERPDNITLLTASDSRQVAYMTDGGGHLMTDFHKAIMDGKPLAETVRGLTDKTQRDQAFVVDHTGRGQMKDISWTYRGDGAGLPEDFKASKDNPVSGLAVFLVDKPGNSQREREDGAMFQQELQKGLEAARALGLDTKVAYTEAEFEQIMKDAKTNVDENGKQDLLMVGLIGHGNLAKQAEGGGVHNKDDESFTAVKNEDGSDNYIHESDFIGDVSFAAESFDQVFCLTGSCHSGGYDTENAFEKNGYVEPGQSELAVNPEFDFDANVSQSESGSVETQESEPQEQAEPENQTTQVEPEKQEEAIA